MRCKVRLTFIMSVAPGLEAVAYSRVVPNDSGAEYVFTQFQLPGMADEVFAAQRVALAEELAILPILFRAQMACPVGAEMEQMEQTQTEQHRSRPWSRAPKMVTGRRWRP